MGRPDLTDAELDSIFDTEARQFIFGDFDDDRRGEKPVLILIGAQPGAGKTRAGQSAIAAAGQPVTPIVGDDLRFFHPDYEALLRQNPAAMPTVTAHVSNGLVERAIEYTLESRRSVLVEGTFRRPGITVGTAQRFKDAGFRVEAHLVAVAPEVSHQSIATRYVDDHRRDGSARFTTVPAHDAAFAALPDTIRALSAPASPVGRIVVRTRDDILLERIRTAELSIKGPLGVARDEWDRPRTQDELDTWHALVESAVDYTEIHFVNDPDVQELAAQLKLDGEYLDLRSDGSTVVRGHLRGGHPVQPHIRKTTRRT